MEDTVTSPVTLEALGQVLTSVGLSAGLILFFVWQAWRREERVSVETKDYAAAMEKREERVIKRLQELEDFTRTTLIDLARTTAVALNQNTVAMNESAVMAKVCVTTIEKLDEDLKAHSELAIKEWERRRRDEGQGKNLG